MAAAAADTPDTDPALSKSKFGFPWRKAKSRDEAVDAAAVEAELRRLEKKVAYLEKKKALEEKIKKHERYCSEHDANAGKSRFPKLVPSFKLRRQKCEEPSGDDPAIDGDNSPSTPRFQGVFGCIDESCSPLVNEINHLPALCVGLICPSETPKKIGTSKSAPADDKTVASDSPEDPQAPIVLTEHIANLATQISKNISEFAGGVTDAPQVRRNDEQALGWMEQVTNAFRSQNLALKDNAGSNIDCLEMLGGKPEDGKVGVTETSQGSHAKFVKVTVGARALSGLSITSKKSDADLPPVQLVLSVLKNSISDEEDASFTHLPSLRVVKDSSRESSEKNKCHVMGVWDLGKEDEASVTFPRLTGTSTFDQGATEVKNEETRGSPSMLHLRICIKREGSDDLLPIGVAKVLISGEARDAELAIPVKTEYYKSLGKLTKKLDSKPPQTKWESLKTFVLDDDEPLTFARFKGFKNETYRLEEDCFIRIKLQVTPDIPNQGPDQESQSSPSNPSSMPNQNAKLAVLPENPPSSEATQIASPTVEKILIGTEPDESKDTMKAGSMCATPEALDDMEATNAPAIELQLSFPEEPTTQKNQKSKKSFFKKDKKTVSIGDVDRTDLVLADGCEVAVVAFEGMDVLGIETAWSPKAEECTDANLDPLAGNASSEEAESSKTSSPCCVSEFEQRTSDDGQRSVIDHLSLAATMETLAVLYQNDFGCQSEPTPGADFEVYEPEEVNESA